MRKILKGNLTITKTSRGTVALAIVDENSHCTFVRMELSKVEFAEALFGLACRPGEMEVSNLEHVGLYKEHREHVIKVTQRELKKAGYDSWDKTSLEAYLREYHQKKGWILNEHLGSQSSINRSSNNSIELKFYYHRYVEKPVEEKKVVSKKAEEKKPVRKSKTTQRPTLRQREHVRAAARA